MNELIEQLMDKDHGASIATIAVLLFIYLLMRIVSFVFKFGWPLLRKSREEERKRITLLKATAEGAEKSIDLVREQLRVSEKNVESLTVSLRVATEAMRDIGTRMAAIERDLNDLTKIRNQINQIFSGLKIIAGPKRWPRVWHGIKKDNLPG